MTVRRSVSTSICLALLACALPAHAGEDLALRALARALQSGAAAAPRALRPLLGELRSRDERQRAEFARLAAESLPPKAAARLAGAREAYERGQGRLLRLLAEATDPLVGEGAGDPNRRHEAALQEARAIVAALEASARPEPLSTELRLRAPSLAPLALSDARPGEAPDAVSPEAAAPDAASAPIGTIPPALQSAADDLGSALAIYSFVRNGIAPEFYHGVLKGAAQTYVERSGNDADTAALLVTLLRARGIPARYVVGQAEVPVGVLRRQLGVAGSVEDALRVLERAGIPHEPIVGPAGIASVKMARVWAEAWLPYANYRGLELDAQGKGWLSLDAAFKSLEPVRGFDVVSELGFDPSAAWDDYQATRRSESPLAFLRARIEEQLAAQRPGVGWEDVLNRRSVQPETLGLLPNSLPYAAQRSATHYELPADLRHELRLVARAGEAVLLEASLPTADALGSRLTLTYVPFDADDQAVVERFGGLFQTPPYLVEVQAILNLDGVPIASATAPVGLGVKFAFELRVDGPAVHETVTNTLLGGNVTALGVGAREVAQQEPQMDAAPRLLAGLAFQYLRRWNEADDELARVFRVVPVRPTLSAAYVMSEINVQYAGGDPQYPLTYEWKGVAVDADFRPLAPAAVERREREKSFAEWSGLAGSELESRVLFDAFQVPSLATVGVIQEAHAQALTVHDLDRTNVEDVLPSLPFDDTVKAEVRDAALRGLLVRIPEAAVSSVEWTGVGYILRDEESGAAAYQLQGGHSGAVTIAVNGFPAAIKDVLTLPAQETADCRKLRPGALRRVSKDFQTGTVKKELKDDLEVKVVDVRGKDLPKACVTFVVMGGGGKLKAAGVNQEYESITVRADEQAVARVKLVMGEKTSSNPGFICDEGRNCDGGQDEYTQVGVNVVGAFAGAASLSEPFTHLARPDERCAQGGGNCQAEITLTTSPSRSAVNLQVAGLMGVRVEDQYQNPISNFETRFAFRSPAELGTPPDGWRRARNEVTATPQNPGRVLKPKDYHTCIETRVNPGWGECSGEAGDVNVRSSVQGAYAYAVVGDSPYSIYTFQIGSQSAPEKAKVQFGTWGLLCSAGTSEAICKQPMTLVFTGTRARRVNTRGDFIEAYPTGAQGDVTLWAVSILEKNHVEYQGDDENGEKIWHAVGDNVYEREVLDDSQYTPQPQSPGTSMGGLSPAGGGVYRGNMGLAATPQDNVVSFNSRHTPRVVLYKPTKPERVVPSTVIDESYADRRKDPARPWIGSIEFRLWGSRVEIEKLDPKSIYVDDQNAATHPTLVRHKVLPDPWRARLEPWQVQFELRDSGGATAVGGIGNEGKVFTIPRGARLPPGDYEARLKVRDVNMRRDAIEAAPRSIKSGLVNMVLDANNDTKVDEQDEQLYKTSPGATFEFWEADPQRGEKASEDAPHLHAVEEYAALRLRLPEQPEEPMYLTVTGAGTHFRIARHVGTTPECGTRSYLCDRTKANQQFQLLFFPNGSGSVQDAALLSWQLQQGDNDVVFSCGPYVSQGDCRAAVSLKLEREVDGKRETLLERAVRFNNVRDLLSVYTARGADTTVAPLAQPCVADGLPPVGGCAGAWAPLPSKEKAPRIFLFVHGYNVNQADNESKWFPLLFKRFYWAGLPLMEAQEPDPNKRFWMAAFGWLGNQGILSEWGSSAMYIENEMNAMQTGVPLGMLLTHTLQGRKVMMMAHSLGNMTASSALSLVPSRTVDTFVMNDAAMAAEAFATSGLYNPVGVEEDELGPHTRRYGRPDDHGSDGGIFTTQHDWIREWRSIVADQNFPSRCLPDPQPGDPSDFTLWKSKLAGLTTINQDIVPQPAYDRRWREHCRLGGGGAADSCSHASAWGGVYADVRNKTNLVNTYNPTDYVITLTDVDGTQWWLFAQRRGKPHYGLFGAGADDRCAMYWAQLEDLSKSQQDDLWTWARARGALDQDKSARAIGRLTRTWGERTYWFPAISTTAGSRDLLPLGIRSINFGTEGQLFHSYLYRERPLASVWSAYVQIKEVLLAR